MADPKWRTRIKKAENDHARGEGQVHHSPLATGPSVATVASETNRENEEVLILCNYMS